MTFMPSSSARLTALSLSAPGCIQMFSMPAFAASSTTASVILEGVITEMPWGLRRERGEIGEALEPLDLLRARVDRKDLAAVPHVAAEDHVSELLAVGGRSHHGEGSAAQEALDALLIRHA